MGASVTPEPYRYFPGPHVRRHGPAGWRDYARYRPWLRDEFCFRCVYCLIREPWLDMRRGYQIDHFIPQKLRPSLKADYDNLLYLCASCNNLKGAWLLPDPCAIALENCLCFFCDGHVEALNSQGEALIEVLNLDDSELVAFRRRKIGTIACLAVSNKGLFREEMGFPNDMPNLSDARPPLNSRPDGIRSSWHAKRAAGKLPETY